MRGAASALAAAVLLGCGPDPQVLRERVSRGEVVAVLPQLVALEGHEAVAELLPHARLLQEVMPQLSALTVAEGPMLRRSVDEAVAEGALLQAALRLSVAAEAGVDGVASLARPIESAARAASPETEAKVLQALSEALAEHSAAQSTRLQQDAVHASIRARYAPGALAATRAGQAGITRAAAVALLEQVDREYVTEVDWTAAVRLGATRLGVMQRSPEARGVWPGLAEGVFTGGVAQDVAGAIRVLDAALRTGKTAGVPDEVVLDELVTGALASLDPWTRAVWPSEIASWTAGHAGVHTGVGLLLKAGPDGSVVVDHPLPDSPAWTSGIHQDDRIEAMSDTTGTVWLRDLPPAERLDLARAALQGPVDTALRLEVRSVGAPDTHIIHLIRGPVVEETVEGWTRDPEDNRWLPLREHGIAYVRISRFRPTTEAAFDALLEPHLDHIRAVVVDLRGNPGGDVNSAVQIADRFVADGWLAELSGRVLPDTGPDVDPQTGAQLAEWNQAIPGHALEGTPVAVLVDEQSASAAEVLAGALQERAGAVVVGRATWGKGLAQALRTAEDGSYAVQFTNVVWTLPSGRQLSRRLNGGGITPEVELEVGPAGRYQLSRDHAMRSALRVHADGSPLRMEPPGARADLPALDADPALLAAELVLLARIGARSAVP